MSGCIGNIGSDISSALSGSAGGPQNGDALQFLADLVAAMEKNGGPGAGSDLVSEILQALEGGSSGGGGLGGLSGGGSDGGGIGGLLGGLFGGSGGGSSGDSGLGEIGQVAGDVLPIAAMFL